MLLSRHPDVRDRLHRQHGLVTRSQLVGLAVPPGTVDGWLRSGQLERVHDGVYRSFAVAADYHQALLAAVLACRRSAVVSHRAACYLWGIDAPGIWGVSDDPPVEITVRGSSRPYLDGVLIHRSTDLIPEHATTIGGIPVTNPLRLLVDLGAVVPDFRVARAFDQLLVKRLVTIAGVMRMLSAVARRGRRGVGALRRVTRERGLGIVEPDSTLESAFADLCRDHHLPMPVYQYSIELQGRRYRVDFAYVGLRIAIELDGWEYHGSHEVFQSDRSRSNELIAAGWTVLRFTWQDVIYRPDYVARIVRDAHRRAAA